MVVAWDFLYLCSDCSPRYPGNEKHKAKVSRHYKKEAKGHLERDASDHDPGGEIPDKFSVKHVKMR